MWLPQPQHGCDVTAPAPATTIAPLHRRGDTNSPLCPQPAIPHSNLPPCPKSFCASHPKPLAAPRPTVPTLPLQFHVLLPFHDLPPRATVPSSPTPNPPVWLRAAGERRQRRQIQQTRPFKKQDETEAAAGAALPQAEAAPAKPREGRAGPGPAQRSSRNGSRHRHNARWAQAQGATGSCTTA